MNGKTGANANSNANAKVINPQPVPGSPSGSGPSGQQGAGTVQSKPSVAKNPADLKQQIKSQFGLMFGSDSDFTISKTYSTVAQGFRFRLDRQKGVVSTSFIPISKKGGLLRPGLLECAGKAKGIMVIQNILTGKPALTMTEDPKTTTWTLVNNETGNATVGQIKVAQVKDTITFSFIWNSQNMSSVMIHCPIRKGGICSSPKPAALHMINFQGKFKSGIIFEENPNGDFCKDYLEMNAIFKDGQAPEMLEFLSMVGLLQAMAVELY